ncbi:RF-PROK-I domain-containing protein [Mycena chlorophos]|uniref:RF-PROK-I domain-containing protein n=1 Tax=Mycena chlorophos TaxID=658473 RepID=A0A8H6TFZ8_MYCCL|nr:RF-PROK-I domain-containing protein [Mycena chlorophos]
MILRLVWLFPARLRHAHNGASNSLPIPPKLAALESTQDNARARQWISQFRATQIPKTTSGVVLSFSRSSGPGGQNVNKVNTKATLRCAIAEDWIPLWANAALKRSPHYVASSQSIQIASTVFRSQAQNISDTLSKLHQVIIDAASAGIRNETSEEQKKHVEDLMKVADARRRMEKTRRKDVKASRKPPRPE